jgi:copper chaperone
VAYGFEQIDAVEDVTMDVRTTVAVLLVAGLVVGQHAINAQQAKRGEARKVAHTCTLKVDGMACGACENRVQKVAKRIDGVTDAVADHRTNTARVTFDPSKTNPAAIAKSITEDAGFRSTPK